MTGVTVTDMIPDGTEYVDGSASLPAGSVNVAGNVITFELGTMEYLDELTFTYQLSTDADNFSVTSYLETVEDVDPNFWFPIPITPDITNYWEVIDIDANSGTNSWSVADVVDESQQILQAGSDGNALPIVGANPVLRFYHSFVTEAGADGGVIEISTDGGESSGAN